ncbi:hypothetical protein [Streptomyces katrae]|uniref:hypothetical protein n=1 Tax=Streptomyces katrae TaxID=68223 RepID=UPI0004C0E5FA|nr:hypothetical protein [Streptomyces katrae]
MTPAEELRAAAETLRQLAADATAGPWRQHDTHLDLGGHTATVLTDRDDINQTELVAWVPTWSHQPWDTARNAWNNAAYMAAMHPGVGAALATLLERQAKQAAEIEQYLGDQFQEGALDQDMHDALAVARAINGQP